MSATARFYIVLGLVLVVIIGASYYIGNRAGYRAGYRAGIGAAHPVHRFVAPHGIP